VRVRRFDIDGPLIWAPERHADARGWVSPSWSAADLAAVGVDFRVAQENLTLTHPGALRGLHWQEPAQAKLIEVVEGRVYDVLVDLRPGSPTLGRWCAAWLDAELGELLYAPRGFAHGFCVPVGAPPARVRYRLDAPWAPAGARSLRWDDPLLGIPWPVRAPLLSPADAAAPGWGTLFPGTLPPPPPSR